MQYTITNVEMTKKTVLERVNNDMTSYIIYKVNFRAYVDENRYKNLVTVIHIFDDDIFEYADKEKLTKKEYQATINELIYSCLDYTGQNLSDVIDRCNNNINSFNKDCRLSWGL